MATKPYRNYELVVSGEFVTKTLCVRDLKVGELAFIIEDSSYAGELVLRTYKALVSITAPNHSWTEPESMTLPVRKLRKGETVVLTGQGE